MQSFNSKIICAVITVLFLCPVKSECQDHLIKIGLLGSEAYDTSNVELKAVYTYLQANSEFSVDYMNYSEFSNPAKSINNFDVIWIHQSDSSTLVKLDESDLFVSKLKDYITNGGNLFLTLEAFRYLNILKLENIKPSVKFVDAIDEGYGRKLGLHSFRSHPVFKGLFGGAYIFSPMTDQVTKQIGFFDNSYPKNGKVIAVDWAYITLMEDSRLMVEYDLGKGKVIALGAYCLMSIPNYQRPHLELFLDNTLKYLSGKLEYGSKYYWDYYSIPEDKRVSEFNFSDDTRNPSTLNPPESKPWEKYDGDVKIESLYAAENLWDVAGERILVMGKEKGGIDEIWTHPFMALRDYEVGLQFSYNDSIVWLNNERPQIEVTPESFTRIYKFRRAYLTEIITADVTKPVCVIHYEYRGVYPAKIFIKMKSNLRFMWPYSSKVFGSIHYVYDKSLNAFILKDKRGDFSGVFGSNKKVVKKQIGRYQDLLYKDSTFIGTTTDKMLIAGMMICDLKMNDNMDFVISASNEGIDRTISYYQIAAADPYKIKKDAVSHVNNLFNNSLMITTPDNEFNYGYRWALAGTDRFFVNTPGVGKALVAGYSTTDWGWDGGQEVNGRPGYAWYFGRDGEWSGFALLDYGDFEKVKEILRFYQDYQDLSGKIFHELTTSGCVHYDAADATPLYIILAGKYLRHSGDIEFIRESWPNIKKAVDYCFSTDTDGDHLIENTLVGHGWVEGGHLYGAHTTLYLASCWAEALEEASIIAGALGYGNESEYYKKESDVAKNIINKDFWNEKDQFLYYGKLKDGSYNPEPTVLAAIPLYYNQVERFKAAPVLKRFSGNGFTSDWGVRILSEDSPLFNPRGYHYGSVWPLFTGWTALAEYTNGNDVQGYTHIMNNLLVYNNWSLGFIEEVLNGEEYKPSGVCRHQCWSETMVLQPVIEGMLGLEVNSVENKVSLSPKFPANWSDVNIDNIRVGKNVLHFQMYRNKNKTEYYVKKEGPDKIIVELNCIFPPGTEFLDRFINKERIYLMGWHDSTHSQLTVKRLVDSGFIFEIYHESGINILPIIPKPKPGYKSEGFRIINCYLNDKRYCAEIEGKSGTEQVLQLFPGSKKIISVENGVLLNQNGNLAEIKIFFEQSEKKYSNKLIIINLKN